MKDKKFVKAVGALDINEVGEILFYSGDSKSCVPVDIQMLRKFPEKFFWKDDQIIMEAIKNESSHEPFSFVVLIFK